MTAQALVDLLKERNWTICSAESLTAGLISSSIAQISGASKVLKGGIVTYTNEIKTDLLGVKSQTLDEFGAVSAEVAKEMAQAAKEKFQSNCAISATGIAGPEAVEGKPVGLVFIGFADENRLLVKELNLTGSREQIRQESALTAINFALSNLQKR